MSVITCNKLLSRSSYPSLVQVRNSLSIVLLLSSQESRHSMNSNFALFLNLKRTFFFSLFVSKKSIRVEKINRNWRCSSMNPSKSYKYDLNISCCVCQNSFHHDNGFPNYRSRTLIESIRVKKLLFCLLSDSNTSSTRRFPFFSLSSIYLWNKCEMITAAEMREKESERKI